MKEADDALPEDVLRLREQIQAWAEAHDLWHDAGWRMPEEESGWVQDEETPTVLTLWFGSSLHRVFWEPYPEKSERRGKSAAPGGREVQRLTHKLTAGRINVDRLPDPRSPTRVVAWHPASGSSPRAKESQEKENVTQSAMVSGRRLSRGQVCVKPPPGGSARS